ncbi:unnamed protein product [Ilex paraguariensis]|uniref:Glycosyltransferase n=1 Tax=Ilex paraguariensis TaxID=185542 RepID=A0ABC8SRU6_9AQUA
MASESKLHVVIFPWLAFGHMIPFLDLSKFIAQKGHKVSFISTPRNIKRLPKLPPNLAPLINLVDLPLPRIHNLPEHAEATIDVCAEDVVFLKKAFDGLENDFSRFLENSSADWVIYDFAPHWLPPIASKLGISCAFFSIFSAWLITFAGRSASMMIDGSDPRKSPEDFTVPPEWVPFPTNLAYRQYETNWIQSAIENTDSGFSDVYRLGSAIMGCDVILIRDCNELEPAWLKLFEELYQKPVIPVGLMPPSVKDSGDEKDEKWVSIRNWLESKTKGSVVYVALGSEVTLSQNDVTELALGLELSGLPFIWALRKPPGSTESDSVELPHGFLERIKGRGLVWTSWVPQLRILSHDSIGGFLTHCGCSSTVEGLMFGHPLIMLPFFVGQGLNALVLVEKKVGIQIQRNEEDGSFTRNSVAESLILVMAENEGRIYREKAKGLSELLFTDNNGEDRYLNQFAEYLESHGRLHKS